MLDAGQLSFANPNSGTGYELVAIASVVIGGTSLFGGEGTVVGTLAGALLLGTLNNILQLNNVNADLQPVVTGHHRRRGDSAEHRRPAEGVLTQPRAAHP